MTALGVLEAMKVCRSDSARAPSTVYGSTCREQVTSELRSFELLTSAGRRGSGSLISTPSSRRRPPTQLVLLPPTSKDLLTIPCDVLASCAYGGVVDDPPAAPRLRGYRKRADNVLAAAVGLVSPVLTVRP
jgi:hypothetical protein